MDEANVYVIEQNAPLDHTLRHSLRFRPSPQDSLTYLVELPELRNDAPRPPYIAPSRPRTSTIVNTLQLSETREQTSQENPLEEYVRKNLPNFRKSLTPGDFHPTIDHRPTEIVDQGNAIINRSSSMLDSQELNVCQKPKNTQNSNKMEVSAEFIENGEYEHRKQRENLNRKMKRTPKITENQLEKKEERFEHDKGVVVMPALEPVSVSQDSPFTKERRRSKNRPPSRVRVMVVVESVSSEDTGNKKIKQNVEREKRDEKRESKDRYRDHGEKQMRKSDESPAKGGEIGKNDNSLEHGKRDVSSKIREKGSCKDCGDKQNRQCDNQQMSIKDETKFKKQRPTEMNRDRYNHDKSISSIDSSSNGFSELNLGAKQLDDKSKSENLNHKSKDSHDIPNEEEKYYKRKPVVYTTDQRSFEDTSEDIRFPERSSLRKPIKQDKGPNLKKRKTPFVEKNQLVYIMDGGNTGDGFDTTKRSSKPENKTKSGMQNKNMRIPDRAVGGTDREDRQDRNQNQKYVTVKAPRSATKMVAKRRFHIQIPEHGRQETWFNVRFNMDDENNVEMNYEGPVKINNYYSSNNYS